MHARQVLYLATALAQGEAFCFFLYFHFSLNQRAEKFWLARRRSCQGPWLTCFHKIVTYSRWSFFQTDLSKWGKGLSNILWRLNFNSIFENQKPNVSRYCPSGSFDAADASCSWDVAAGGALTASCESRCRCYSEAPRIIKQLENATLRMEEISRLFVCDDTFHRVVMFDSS